MGAKKYMLLFTFLITLAVAIPVFENDSNKTTEILETREEMMNRYRLPNNTLPRLYKINIEPDMFDYNFTWSGESSIDFEVLESTKILTLHAYKNLVIDENFTELIDFHGQKHRPIGQTRDEIVEFFMIEFERDLLVGNYSLNLKYEGEDTREDVGFYKASFQPAGFPNVAATHFEATTARRAFPCWDEPGLKARFQMFIKHDRNLTAISNMPEIESVETPDGKILTTFDTTPIMSVYLLTFVIAEYDSVTNEHGNVTVWANKHIIEEVRHILKTSERVVDFMESYTGLPFGFPRVGSVLLPIYSAAATEHWGLVSYYENIVRFNETTDTTSQLDSINLMIAHELAHSWFGNRISPRWWNDLWLNEAFAAYFQYQIMDEIHENWGGLELFILRNNHDNSLQYDVHNTNIYIRWTPVTNTEIRRLFGIITYRKGASIVHMFRNVLGDDVFRAGLKKFLTKRSFKAAEANDLIEAFQEVYDENENPKIPLNVNETMMTWLMQTGYPIVNVTRNYTSGDTEVKQKSVIVGDSEEKKWWIPLNYATKTNLNFSSTLPSSWISDKENAVTIRGIDKDDWVIFNVRASGYYRVNYDDENWKRIVKYLNTDNYKNINVLNRAQLISDAHFFLNYELIRDESIFWQLIKYLSREVEYLPWESAMSSIKYLEYTLTGTESHETFQKYIMGMMDCLIEKVGFETHDDDDHLTKLSREDIVGWACASGHSGCAEFSANKLLRMIENPADNRLHPDNRAQIFCAGLRALNDTSIQRVVEWALVNDEMLLFKNLGCTENHEIHKNFLLGTLNVNFTEGYPMNMAYSNILISSDGNFNFAVDFFMENHQALNDSYQSRGWDDPTREIVRMISENIKTKARLEKFKRILDMDVVKNLNHSTYAILLLAERDVANANVHVEKFQTLWDKYLSFDNTIS